MIAGLPMAGKKTERMNVFEHLMRYGDCENYVPFGECEEPCDAQPGSPVRVDTYAKRVELGLEIFSDQDRQVEEKQCILNSAMIYTMTSPTKDPRYGSKARKTTKIQLGE